jgi:RimJ/RimL family protein N-acetyltransferase
VTRLETERLLLREPAHADAAAFSEFWSDPEGTLYVGGTKTPEEVDEMIERMMRHWSWFGIGNFTVERKEDGHVLGRVGFLLWDPERWVNGFRERLLPPLETELGRKLGRRYWSHGYATEAALPCRDWALGELGHERLISLIALPNTASIRVAEKIGERFEREVEGGPFRHPVGVWSLGESA